MYVMRFAIESAEREMRQEMTCVISMDQIRYDEHFTVFKYFETSHLLGNDHTNMTAPLPVRSAKLSMFGPG
jgi:hypothetical protein